MLALVFILLAVATALSTTLTLMVRTVGRRALLHDSAGSAGHQKRELRRVPNIGGVAIFATIAVLMALGLFEANTGGPLAGMIGGDSIRSAVETHAPGMKAQTPMAVALLICLGVLHVLGLIDDRRALPAVPKLLVIAGASAAMVVGFDCRLLTFLDAHVGGSWASWIVTILWFLAVTNAMNFMDNMDGLSAGVGVVASSFFLAAAVLHGQWFIALTLALLIGALLGFLVFNFPWPRRPAAPGAPPRGATIFMGDAGSLVIGFLLAFLTVRTTYIDAGPSALPGTSALRADASPGAWYAVFMPLCVLAVPLYDLVSVCVIRVAQGKSPLVGDQQHFSHRLRARGLTVRQTLAVICGCAAVTGIGGVLLASTNAWQAVLIGVQTCVVLALLGIYEHASAAARGAP
ncbi:MAG: MraY family glycosyltransferase [Phycisphaerales bacterium]